VGQKQAMLLFSTLPSEYCHSLLSLANRAAELVGHWQAVNILRKKSERVCGVG